MKERNINFFSSYEKVVYGYLGDVSKLFRLKYLIYHLNQYIAIHYSMEFSQYLFDTMIKLSKILKTNIYRCIFVNLNIELRGFVSKMMREIRNECVYNFHFNMLNLSELLLG